MGAGINSLIRKPPYLPFLDGPAKVAPQLKPISETGWLTPDPETDWLPRKQELLETRREDVFALPDAVTTIANNAAGLIRQHVEMHRFDSEMNQRSSSAFEAACRMISDDVCLMVRDGDAYALRAACLCTPTFWSLRAMLNRPLGGLHQEVPGGDPGLASRISRIFTHLKPEIILERFNWTVQLDGEKFTPSSAPMKEALKTLSPAEASARLHLRVERQTVRKLENHDAVIFTIRVSTDRLAPILSDRSICEQFRDSWDGTPADLALYKGWPHYQRAIDWLIRSMSAEG